MPYLKSCTIGVLLLVSLLCANVEKTFAQTIKGKVYRANSDTVVANAIIYYGGSMAGTIADEHGNFELNVKQQQIPITVSCVGYFSSTVYYEPGKPLIVYLKPKTVELKTVTIRADGKSRKEEIEIFIHEFIGTSYYARNCTIANMDDVNLFYDKKSQTLTANCDKPLIIENKELGYIINYYLDKFESTPKNLRYTGNYIFKENPVSDAKRKAEIINNREDAYRGSRMEFIRSVWHHHAKNLYSLFTQSYSKLTEDSIMVTDTLGQKYLHLKKNIIIVDARNAFFVDGLASDEKMSFIDQDGFYDASLKWSGNMAFQRIGDLLPFEYHSAKEADYLNNAPPAIQTKKTLEPQPSKPANGLVFEKTFVHTDRDVYATGDTIWFKAYLVNAQNNTPIASSGNLYVELISPTAKIISSELIRLDDGFGNGDFNLPDSIPPGKYHLRAYTNWMRNFGDNFIFDKEFTILKEVVEATAVKPKTINKLPAATATKKPAIPLTATVLPLVRFYPEGGSLVQGISSWVAVKADDGFGKGIPAWGVVLSTSGDTVARFNCDTLGMGLFALIPLSGQTYHAEVSFTGNKQPRHDVFQLPAALTKGLSLQIRQRDSTIQVIVSCTTDDANAIKPVYTIALKHAGITVLSSQLQLASQQNPIKISTAALPEGICSITLYDEHDKPNCERLVYIHRPNESKAVNLSTDKKTYLSKELVNVQINTKEAANLSIAVVDAGIVPEQAEDIVSYLLLQSEVKGNIEHARRYFDTTNVNRFKQLDLLLMTQGWRDFVWRRMADTAIRVSYAAENGITVSGLVKDEVNNKVLPNLNVTLYADAAKGDKIYYGNTNPSGRFSFTGLRLYGTQNVKLASVNAKGEKKGSFWLDTIKPMPIMSAIKAAVFIDTLADTIINKARKKRAALINISNIKGVTHLKEVTITADKNYVKIPYENPMMTWGLQQEFNITPKDYEYNTLLWFLLKNDKRALPQVGFPGLLYIIEGKTIFPDVVINGVLIPYYERQTYPRLNPEYKPTLAPYFAMPMEKFKKVEVHQVMQIVDNNRLTYVIVLTTKPGAMTDNPGTLSIDIPCYYQARTFYQPPPGAKPSVADYRTTIHWEPNIKTDTTGKAKVSFYNAVPPANIRVIVQGISNSGQPVAATTVYSVQ
jgi:hypothetical protein